MPSPFAVLIAWFVTLLVIATGGAAGGALLILLRSRAADIWLGAYAADRWRKRRWPSIRASGSMIPSAGSPGEPLHVFLCICDHFEPMWGDASSEQQERRIAAWVEGYPRLVADIRDSRGRPPQQTFFYPQEEYFPRHLEALAALRSRGLGDVEIHLHHERDTSGRLAKRLLTFRDLLHERHGLLRRDAAGKLTYGFIHGNWALDNSHPRGWHCGVNDELSILVQTGCYADFTLPAAPDRAQTRTVNAIYYALDNPRRPKSHDRGQQVRVGGIVPQGGLLMIQGPLMLSWRRRKWGLLPRLENGALTADAPPTLERFALWCRAGVVVQGFSQWRFIKLHTHGCQEANLKMLLGRPMLDFHTALADAAKRGNWRYYYVTAWEMANLVELARRGGPASGMNEIFNGAVLVGRDRSRCAQRA